jgi:pimeloyl-ACP methyl ester carboxylesterase
MTMPHEVFAVSHDGLRLYYRDYENAAAARIPVLCLHGLTRNSRDFEELAAYLARTRRVIVPDMRGRGQSSPDPNYKNYQIPTYTGDVLAILAEANIQKVIVIGTSMGGVMAMALAAEMPGLLAGVVLNDIGPEIDPRGMSRIAGYVGRLAPVQNWAEAARQMQTLNQAAFPDYGPNDWMAFARRSYRENHEGRPVLDYDPRIGDAVRENNASAAPANLWPLFTLLKNTPVLTIQGETSDILSRDTLSKMHEVHSGMTSAIMPGRGHSPSLSETESRAALKAFLENL